MLNFSARRVALIGASVVVVVAVAALTGACGARPTAAGGEPVVVAAPTTGASRTSPPSTSSVPTATPSEVAPPAVAGVEWLDAAPMQQAAVSVEPNTTLGAVVYDRTRQRAMLSVEADRQFRSASLVKLLIAIDALSRGPDADDRQRIARMLSVSDDDIASALWVQGGPDIVTRTAMLIGLQNTEPPESAGMWGDVKITANDMVRVYQYVMDRLSPEDHTLVVDALAQAPQYAADGFDQYFGIPDGLNTQRAIKQGWGNNSQAMVLHSTGLVGQQWRYIVILLSEHPLGSGWTTSATSVTAAAGALNGQLPGA